MQEITEDVTVIIVDDDSAIRNSLKFSLELEGFCVQTYAGPGELLAQGHFPRNGCCLVVDYKLPEMNGLQLLRNLRERKCWLPAILITTNPNADLMRQAKDAGVTLIEKPLLGDCLIRGIHSALMGGGGRSYLAGPAY